jgi:hypothetical protein
MLVFRRKRAPPGPTQVLLPWTIGNALREPPDQTWCIGMTYAEQEAPNGRRTRRLAFAIA